MILHVGGGGAAYCEALAAAFKKRCFSDLYRRTNWLAKEREAEEQGKALSAQKMKSYFKKALSGVARFKRWLEGRTFINSKDWYGVLCRKLHSSLGKTAEAAHDREQEGGDRNRCARLGSFGTSFAFHFMIVNA